MTGRKYKYERSDFGALPVKLEHLDIGLSFEGERVEGEIVLHMTAARELTELALDARDLEIRSVETAEGTGLAYDYQRSENRLVVSLPDAVAEGARFAVRARAACVPSSNILEGLYKDTTPKGSPQQYMSQCQQWGFQRILPILDDCRAKCTMTTTLEADARYTHLISNGNIDRARNPDGKPVPKPGAPSRQVITYENPVPMAPYLFIVCVGTWEELADEIVYPSGRRVRLEYLVPPGRAAGARVPMEILKESVLWQARTQEYEYPGEVYRTICMEKSNFGGMENVGNTTIVTDAAMVDEYTDDQRLLYAHGVIVHEFEHNQCGSEVTMETPFDMWLNEAFTVDVERQFMMEVFDPDFIRLDEVDGIRGPLRGPLAIEDAGRLGNIVRAGFNDPDELVDGVTYVKAAEVIRMLRLVLGADAFRAGKNLYFERYHGGNANTDQFFACFEEVSGRELGQFKKEWLYTIGYPRIAGSYTHDSASGRLTVELTQSRGGEGGLFHVPVKLAAVTADGSVIPETDTVVEVTDETCSVTFENVAEPPAFVSFNQDYSFYGTFKERDVPESRLAARARLEPNAFNRVEAVRELTDIERIRLVKDIDAPVGEAWLEILGELIAQEGVPAGLKSYLLRIDEQPMDRSYLTWYRELYAARRKLMAAVADRHMPVLRAVYEALDTYVEDAHPNDGLEKRGLKAVLLGLINAANTEETQTLAEQHFRRAWNISDKTAALSAVYRSDHPERLDLLAEGFELWQHRLSAYANYLRLIGRGIHEDVFELLAREATRPSFRLEHPTFQRALFLPMTANNKMLWTDQGIAWVADRVIELAPINQNTALHLLAAFRHVHKLAEDLKPKVLAALERMHAEVDAVQAPSVAGRVGAYLKLET